METVILKVEGMHCGSCARLIESELSDQTFIETATVNVEAKTLTVTGDFGDRNQAQVVLDLNQLLTPHGYTVSRTSVQL